MWKDFKKIRRVHERAKSSCIKEPLLPRRVQSTPLSASSTQHTWELLAAELHGTSPTTCAGKADQELPWSVCQLPHLGKRKIEENLIFHYSFIQCSTEKLLFSVQHFCGNIRIFVATTVLPLSTLCGLLEISTECLWHWRWRRSESSASKAFHNLNGVI